MDTQFLNTFVRVVDQGSMAAAARELNISAAAVAQQMHKLERYIGAPLLARAGRTVKLTEAGARILQRARDLLRDVSDLSTLANDEDGSGELRLGAGINAQTGLLPDILVRMVQKYPRIKVFVSPGRSLDLYRSVESGELDAALVLKAPFVLSKTCEWRLLREEQLMVLAHRSMAGRDPHELLASEPLIRYDREQWSGHLAEQYLRAAGITPIERVEIHSLNAIAVMVDRGLGVSLVPDWAPPWPEGLRLARIALPKRFESCHVGVVWSRSTIRMRWVKAFVQESLASVAVGRTSRQRKTRV